MQELQAGAFDDDGRPAYSVYVSAVSSLRVLAALVEGLGPARPGVEIGGAVAAAAAELIGADAVVLALAVGGTALEILGAQGDPALVDLAAAAESVRRSAPVSTATALAAPIVLGDRTVGALVCHFAAADRSFDQEQVQLGLLAGIAGLALERARLAERAAVGDLVGAERLSTIRHDLKNPLGAILMAAGGLLQLELGEPSAARIRKRAEIMHKAAHEMARLIDDLAAPSSRTR